MQSERNAMKNKTVFDVNIWLRYFISGKAEKIIDMIENNDVLFVEQVAELVHTQTIFDQCPDPKDNYLFDLAYQSNANFLVSDDKIVLATPIKQTLKLLSLYAFKAEIGITE